MFTFQCPTGLLKKNQGGRYNDSSACQPLTGWLWKQSTITDWGYLCSQISVHLSLSSLHYLLECTLSHFFPWFWIPHYTCSPVFFANCRTDLPISQGCIPLINSDWPWRFMGFHSLKPLYPPMSMLSHSPFLFQDHKEFSLHRIASYYNSLLISIMHCAVQKWKTKLRQI